jgi:hypothetical protein
MTWIEEADQKLRCGLGFYDGAQADIATLIESMPITGHFSVNKGTASRAITLFTKKYELDK